MKTNSELQRDVQNELNWESSITSGEIGVTVKDGVVTLTGTVSHRYSAIPSDQTNEDSE